MPAVLVQPTRLASTNEVFNEHKDQLDNAYSRRIKQMMHPTLQAALDILQTPHTEATQCKKSGVNTHIALRVLRVK